MPCSTMQTPRIPTVPVQVSHGTAEHIGQCQTGQDAADQMQGPGGHSADEQENKTSCTVFGQVADVFKGGKATAMPMAAGVSLWESGSKIKK